MFTVEQRDHVQHAVLTMARADPRVVAGALIGSLASGANDPWADLDLGFGVVEGTAPRDVLEDWTPRLEREFGAVRLFDLPSRSSIYRVFLLPGCLQMDVSVTPAADFGARGPKFRLLFGRAAEVAWPEAPSAEELFGVGVHHALRARYCVARGRLWQAQYWIAGLRDQALTLACRQRGLEVRQGRGYDALPSEVLAPFADTLVRVVTPEEVLRALAAGVDGLLRAADPVRDLASRVEGQLRCLASPAFLEPGC